LKSEAGRWQKKQLKSKGKRKADCRERIGYLCDPGRSFIEIGGVSGGECMKSMWLPCRWYGSRYWFMLVERQCVMLANDQTVKAGAWFPITGKKNLRMQEIAMEKSSSGYLPG